ncbi:pilus assembly protein FimV [Telluria mixta]|uniref:Pilus assembly protein FimV n=1 Tax=Telluria mixta TaxID=34071 RepID=A0ABT2C996_9BURK|nr:FimV/HubP family polar landmark protein [Telluria mixta]MCS0633955.1 pilus assembly protein FimV [Telluria mixta]WEM93150.1 pilus assembly protein FimV [Telluria mixta]
MHVTPRLPMKSSALKKLTAAVASALVLTSAAHAAGLGKLTVLSALGQPLRAEIELTAVSGDEASGLAAKLASPEAFKAANIDFNPALLSLRFNVEQRGGRQFIRVSSTQPLNEPFVDMLLELSWNNGRLVREYTFLLDPAELRATQSAQVAAGESARPRTEAAPAPAQSSTAPAAERPRRVARAETTEAPKPAAETASQSRYRVKQGDSLGRIAAQLKPVDVSLDMMLVALYRANPDAFIGNNMNRLKSGRILTVPAGDAVRGTDDTEAHGVVVAHAADFNAYRNKLAGQVGASEPVKTPEPGQGAAGKITAKVEERPTAANESQDKLRLSKAAPTTPAGKGTTMSTEDRIAKEKELADAQTRVRELERNVSDLEKVATIKSKAGAEAEKNASAPAPVAATPPAPQPAPQKLPAIKPAAKPAAAPPEPGLMDFIMDNLPLVGGGAAALLLGGLLVAQRRKKKVVKVVPEPSILGVPSEPAHSMFAETGGQSVDTNNSVFNSSFAPSASQLDTNEVDPVAEADVYIAYGRDAQAEEILKEALRTHPERYPVRLKLLEIYAARKDQRAFETQAAELYSMTRGQGDEWAQAAALGLTIDPLNPLYQHTTAPSGPAPSTEELGQQVLLSKELDDVFSAPDPQATPTAALAGEPLDFSQHFADAMATAQPAPAPVTNAPSTEPAPMEDDHVLDFDLGGLAFEPVEPAAAPQAAAAPAADLGGAHDLDFDMSAFETPAAPAPAAEPAVALDKREDDPLDFSFDMDFAAPAPNPVPQLEVHTDDDLLSPAAGVAASTAAAADIEMANLAREFDLPDLPTELQANLPPEPEQSARDPLFDLDAMDFGLDETPRAESPASIPTAALDEHLFDIPATPAPAEAPFAEHDRIVLEPAVPQFDVGGFDLDLPADGSLPLPEVQSLSEPQFETHAAPAEPAALSAAQMEMETKLDLAIAYQEIGDKEGARELLDEVIRGGNPEQAARASSMRATLV